MKYGIKALMAAGVLVFAVGVQGALAAPASGKAAVNKLSGVRTSAKAKARRPASLTTGRQRSALTAPAPNSWRRR